MAISLSSVLGFTSAVKYQYAPSSSVVAFAPKAILFTSPYLIFAPRRLIKAKPWNMCLSVANKDHIATDTDDNSSASSETSPSEVPNGSTVSSNPKQEASSSQSSQPTTKRSSLTARERLKAARVLNRYAETKAPKPEMGSTVLAALRESDRGKKRSGLPEAPTNLFDDSKRGMPKQGLTFEFPGGADLFFIVLSFVLISTLMFATTFVVWKVGAIHFNEY